MASGFEQQRSTAQAPGSAQPQALPEMTDMPFEAGLIIHGKYEILRLIGTGGVGFVVAARHIGFDDVVALKFLRPEFATNTEAVSRFTIEARASFRLRSEHVARVLDVDMFDDVPFIAMELLEGTDLRTMLDRQRVLEIEPAIDCVLQACEALSAAHGIGVIHRDIKPENLFLVGNGDELDQLKVLDFGISKVALVSSGRTTHHALTRIAVGTPPYMSPEQVRASSDLDARSDLWSLGCVLYELLTGTAPFDRISLMQSCAAVLEEDPVPPIDLRPAIPEALSETIMRCLRKDAAERFADVAELALALSPFGSGRFASYAGRCRAFLSGEGPGRRSTPSALAPVSRHSTGTVPAAVSGSFTPIGHNTNLPALRRSIAVRLPSEVPLTRRPSQQRISHGAPRVPRQASVAPQAPATPRRPTVQPAREASTSEEIDFPPKRKLNRPLFWGGAAALIALIVSYLMSQPPSERAATLKPRPARPPSAAVAAPAEDIPVIKPRAELTGEVETASDMTAATEAAAASALPMVKAPPAPPTPATISASSARPHSSSYSRAQRTAAAATPAGSGKLGAPNRVDDEPDVGF
jgi:serine/threonine-protein kinase